MNPWLEAFLWAGGVVFVAFEFISNYAAVVDFWKKLGADNGAQPMIAISVARLSKELSNKNDGYYPPFKLKPGEEMTLEQRADCSYDYDFVWNYVMHFRNQTEHTAYKIKVIDLEDLDVFIDIKPKIEYTKPISKDGFIEHTFKFLIYFRCTPAKSEEIYSGVPVPKVRIEYSNLAGTRFATEYFFAEKDDAKKNVYSKVG